MQASATTNPLSAAGRKKGNPPFHANVQLSLSVCLVEYFILIIICSVILNHFLSFSYLVDCYYDANTDLEK